jgi:hypothetical protein
MRPGKTCRSQSASQLCSEGVVIGTAIVTSCQDEAILRIRYALRERDRSSGIDRPDIGVVALRQPLPAAPCVLQLHEVLAGKLLLDGGSPLVDVRRAAVLVQSKDAAPAGGNTVETFPNGFAIDTGIVLLGVFVSEL